MTISSVNMSMLNPQAFGDQAFGDLGARSGGPAGCGNHGGGMGPKGPTETFGEMDRQQNVPEEGRRPEFDRAFGGSGTGARQPTDVASGGSGAGAKQPGETIPDPSNMSIDETFELVRANPELGEAFDTAFGSDEVQAAMTDVIEAVTAAAQELGIEFDPTGKSVEQLTQEILTELLPSTMEDPDVQAAVTKLEEAFSPAFTQALGDAGFETITGLEQLLRDPVTAFDREQSHDALNRFFGVGDLSMVGDLPMDEKAYM